MGPCVRCTPPLVAECGAKVLVQSNVTWLEAPPLATKRHDGRVDLLNGGPVACTRPSFETCPSRCQMPEYPIMELYATTVASIAEPTLSTSCGLA